MTIEEVTTKTVTCKNCGSTACVKFGSYKGVQRYWCKSCNRKFKGDDDSFHEKVSLEKAYRRHRPRITPPPVRITPPRVRLS